MSALELRVAELTEQLSLSDRLLVAEMRASAKYKDALNDIQARVASGYFVDAEHLGDIARGALKDGP